MDQEVKTKRVRKSKETPDRFTLSETGYLGLNMFGGVTRDEIKSELNFPSSFSLS